MLTKEEIIKRIKERPIGVIGKRKEFSVLIPLVENGDELSVLFEIRGKTINQPGDICLPGGKIENDESIIDAALRETEEEIGISREQIEVVGRFDSMLEVNRLRLHTVVGLIKEEDINSLKLCDYEVQEIFTVPLEFFKNNEPDYYKGAIIQDDTGFPYEEHGISPNYKWRKAWQDIYFWHYEDKVIWGLTAGIIQWLVEEIL